MMDRDHQRAASRCRLPEPDGAVTAGCGQELAAVDGYHIAVVIAAARRQGSLRFGRVLDWAQRAGLLRVSGVSYQFRHRELQDRLMGLQMTAAQTGSSTGFRGGFGSV